MRQHRLQLFFIIDNQKIFRTTMKKYLTYLFRWQTSSLVLAPVAMAVSFLGVEDKFIQISVGNLLGGIIFWHIDKLIFKK